MKTLEQLKNELLADGIIDAEEVKELEKVLYEDGVIDSEEAEFLFEINDAVSGKNNDPGWDEFFIRAITDYLLNDEESPGEIDDVEANWLYEKIKGDGQVDEAEKRLLNSLKEKSKNFPNLLNELM